jgi:hypothetical protein
MRKGNFPRTRRGPARAARADQKLAIRVGARPGLLPTGLRRVYFPASHSQGYCGSRCGWAGAAVSHGTSTCATESGRPKQSCGQAPSNSEMAYRSRGRGSTCLRLVARCGPRLTGKLTPRLHRTETRDELPHPDRISLVSRGRTYSQYGQRSTLRTCRASGIIRVISALQNPQHFRQEMASSYKEGLAV